MINLMRCPHCDGKGCLFCDGSGYVDGLELGKRLRDEAMDEVEGGADPDWLRAAHQCVRNAARQFPMITTDHVFALLDPLPVTTRDTRAIGPVMKQAGSDGVLQATERFEPCRRGKRHASPLRVWLSLIYVGRTQR